MSQADDEARITNNCACGEKQREKILEPAILRRQAYEAELECPWPLPSRHAQSSSYAPRVLGSLSGACFAP